MYISAQNLLHYMSRKAWGAKPPSGELYPFHGPVDFVVITHTATTQQADTMDEYCHQMQLIQELNKDTGRTISYDVSALVGT